MIKEFIKLINENQSSNMAVVEIGVYDGATTIHYAPIIKQNHGTLWLVDSFLGNVDAPNEIHGYYPEKADKIRATLINNLQLIDVMDITTILEGDSVKMAAKIPDRSVDICFIDADHRYEPCKADILAYLPKVKPRGIIAGHDCKYPFPPTDINTYSMEELNQQSVNNKGHVGVAQAVYDIFGSDVQVIPLEGDTPIWIKRL